jgi:hypothetical protein
VGLDQRKEAAAKARLSATSERGGIIFGEMRADEKFWPGYGADCIERRHVEIETHHPMKGRGTPLAA